jgi:hypothetical protein
MGMEATEESTLELSEREIAIARGEDPDTQVDQTSPADTEVSTEATGEAEAATDSGDTGGTEAADKSSEAGLRAEEPAKDGEQGGKEAATGSSWLDSETRTLGQSYGLSDDELKGFTSAEEFRRFTSFYDKQLAAGKLAKPQDSQAAAQEKPSEQPEAKAETVELDVEAYRKAGYDDDTIRLVQYAKGLKEKVDAFEPQINEMRQHFVQQQQQQQIQVFHDAVDQLDEKLFGRSIDKSGRFTQLPREADENRRKLFGAMQTLSSGMLAQGQELPPVSVLLKRAEQFAFAEEVESRAKRKVQEQLTAQSKRRRPAPASRAARPTATKKQPGVGGQVSEIVDNPEIVKLWNQMQEENGAS